VREDAIWTAARVRALRVAHGHTVDVAALTAGVSRSTWIRWEQRRSPARPQVMDLYALRGGILVIPVDLAS